jgi:hypothetical protein
MDITVMLSEKAYLRARVGAGWRPFCLYADTISIPGSGATTRRTVLGYGGGGKR